MVAYNLLLSIFPLALIALFVAGRVLRSPELAASVLDDLQHDLPDAPPRARWLERCRSAAAVLDRRSASSRSSPRCGSAPRSGARWTPRSAASTTCRAARGCARSCSASGCSSWCWCSSPRASRCRRVQALLVSSAQRPAVRPRRRRAASSTARRSLRRPGDAVRRAVHHLPARAQGRDPVDAACGRARSARRSRWRRRLRVPALPAERLDAADRHQRVSSC